MSDHQRVAALGWKDQIRWVRSTLGPASSLAKGISQTVVGSVSEGRQQDQVAALQRIVYRSRATEAYCGSADFQQILKVAVRSNAQNRITGALALSDDIFVQVLEGPAARLEELLVKLGQDPRHTDLKVLGRWGVSGRLFSGWTMAHADLADACPRLHQRFRSDGSGLELVNLLFDAAVVACPLRL